MSMSDTAEYWFNKGNHFSFPNTYRHAKDVVCGHNHNVMDTIYMDDVECRACVATIKENRPEWMLDGKAPAEYYMSNSEKKRHRKLVAFRSQHGVCPCGCDWQIRKNRTNGSEFLGCINYPKCKNTKSIQK